MCANFSQVTGDRLSHMDLNDAKVWDRWLKKHLEEKFWCEYDVPCGRGRQAVDVMGPVERALWQTLTVKRADVVVHWVSLDWVVEVKPRVCMSGLGQVLSYLHLYRLDHPPISRSVAWLVAGEDDPELRPVFQNAGVSVEVVEE